MNRKERRKMEKELGLRKFYKKDSFKARNKRIKGNQERGQEMEKVMKEQVERIQNEQNEQKESNIIAWMAENIAKEEKIPLIDAMELANKKYFETNINNNL